MDPMEEIYKKHGEMIYNFPLTRVQDLGLVEELTQETFYQAMKHIDRHRGESGISTWFYTIVRNLWRDYLWRQRRHVPLEEADQVSAESAKSKALCSWDNIQILSLIHSLKDPMREVTYLRLAGNLTFGQIGEIMGRSENWVRTTYYHGEERVVKEAEKIWTIGYHAKLFGT